MKVNFMILGAMKCGTSTLYRHLDIHPQIIMSHPKEPHYFSKIKDWKKNLEQYHSNFKQKTDVVYGEASTTYTMYPRFNLNIWEDIYDYNPNMKFIYIIRNPVDRTILHYMHLVERGYIKDSLKHIFIREPLLIDFSRYYIQIEH